MAEAKPTAASENREHFNQFKLARFQTPEFLEVPPDLHNHPDARVVRRVFELAGPLEGKTVYVPGCGTGYEAVLAAKLGARVLASDISEDILDVARRRIIFNKVAGRVVRCQDNAENSSVRKETVDVVLSHSLLHHLNLGRFAGEMKRILKPGGRFCFSQPFGENPFLEFARKHLPYPMKHRCTDEQPLSASAIQDFLNNFSTPVCEPSQFLSMIERVLPFRPLVTVLDMIDRNLLNAIPPLNRFCRIVLLAGTYRPG